MARISAAFPGTTSSSNDEDRSCDLGDHIIAAVSAAREIEAPFPRLELHDVFPATVYSHMLSGLPATSSYRPMNGRSRDSKQTRVKLDLLPEYTRKLAPVWNRVGRALRSKALQQCFMRKLSPGLSRRFGPDFLRVPMYPIPILTRDVTGYTLPPHTDTDWKGITVQLYLPNDFSIVHIGTVFHAREPDGSMRNIGKVPFAPNSGYAFAVSDDSWHSTETVGGEVVTRDSILLTYFVDQGILRKFRNRGKRFGNLALSPARQLSR